MAPDPGKELQEPRQLLVAAHCCSAGEHPRAGRVNLRIRGSLELSVRSAS